MSFLLLLLFFTPAAFAQKGVCDIIDMPSCHAVSKQFRRTSATSLPSPASSANVNPATVSFDRGLGVEAIAQAGNPVAFNLASGTGRIGGALISHSLENSFFGNRVPELPANYILRQEDDKQYKSKKLNLALGTRLIRKGNFALDAGVLFKRHSEIRRVNPGAGLSGRIGPVTWGASVYQDDFLLKWDMNTINPETGHPHFWNTWPDFDYQERFLVQSYTIGTRIRNLSFDAGLITSKPKYWGEQTKVALYSFGYSHKNFLFNYGIRNEHSSALLYEDGAFKEERRKYENYAGVQCSVTRYLILGVQYNYFLLREVSVSGSVFF